MIKVMILTPCMETLDVRFVQSLENLDRTDLEVRTAFVPGSLVYHARNELAKVARDQKPDIVMWVDSDMVFEPDTLKRLIDDIDDDHPIVSTLCFRRRAPFNPPIYKKLRMGRPGEEQVESYDMYPETELFEVEGAGFGCVAMKLEVLNIVNSKYALPFMPIPGFGEDLSFCLRAREFGFKVYCDSRIKIGHVGQTIVTEDTFKNYLKAHLEA